jgi:hypothetical protein
MIQTKTAWQVTLLKSDWRKNAHGFSLSGHLPTAGSNVSLAAPAVSQHYFPMLYLGRNYLKNCGDNSFIIFKKLPPYTLAGFDLTTRSSNLFSGRRR